MVERYVRVVMVGGVCEGGDVGGYVRVVMWGVCGW